MEVAKTNKAQEIEEYENVSDTLLSYSKKKF